MFNLNLNFNFKFLKKKKDDVTKLYNASKNFNLSVLPVSPEYCINNLFPVTNHVDLWSTFIIGNDKSYILCNVGDVNVTFQDIPNIINTKGVTIPKDLFIFLNNVWDMTLQGKNLQFFIVLDSRLYIFNSYCLTNEKNQVIGATGFMRNFESIKIDDINLKKKIN